MRINQLRVSKAEWYRLGGFANSRLWRRMRNGTWEYYYDQS